MDNFINKAYTLSPKKALDATQSDPEKGLTSIEAEMRLKKFGANAIESTKKVSPLKILFNNTNNIIVYLLISASIVAFVMNDIVEGIAVIVAILIAIISGFITEYKAQKSVESLQNMIKTVSKVIRDSKIKEIDSKNIVVGDILFIEEGDSITADARIIENKNFASIESTLTGESEAVNKDENYAGEEDAVIGDRKNMVFMGTAATRGNAYAVVTSTGMNTEIGKISGMLKNAPETSTPLENQLNKLGKTLIIFSTIVAVIVTISGLISGEEVYFMIKIGIVLAIAAVPESLPAVSTITLAIGMKVMASHNALVKSLPAVETLGSTTVICTDKTGTLTENQMTVKQVYLSNGIVYEVCGNGYNPEGEFLENESPITPSEHKDLISFMIAGVLSSNASLIKEDDIYKIIGDPTEGGIVVMGKKAQIDRDSLSKKGFERIGEIPFNSKDKFMVTAYDTKTEGKKLYIKGAPDIVLQMSNLDKNSLEKYLKLNEKIAYEGMRVLAVAQLDGYLGNGTELSMKNALDKKVDFLGFVGIMDPPREDVKLAIKETHTAGIRTIMITGDHPKTAQIIAKKIGMEKIDKVISGKEMDKMNDEELAKEISSTSIFARVSPENKLQILSALNIHQEVTAMTGDGVNDAPALNEADIGVAMGIRGTQVAKDASDMILMDDKFSTIVHAVKNGRVIFDNIEKFINFLFACNVVEILVVFLTIILGYPMPILALHVLWLNLVVDILPALSLAWEPAEDNIMKRKPRNPQKPIIDRTFLIRVLINGAIIGFGSLVVFIYSLKTWDSEVIARTMTFCTMGFGQLFYLFNVRHKNHFGLDKTIFRNIYLIYGLLISIALQVVAVQVPFLNNVLETEPLNLDQWIMVIFGAIIPISIIQILIKLFTTFFCTKKKPFLKTN